MTREETITVLKAFMENPLFSEVHKAAFNIAIHDIKQRHDWDINKLMLVPKTEWEQDHAILKAYSDGVNEVLDKIRAEIKPTRKMYFEMNDVDWVNGCDYVLSVIDKYKAETEK